MGWLIDLMDSITEGNISEFNEILDGLSEENKTRLKDKELLKKLWVKAMSAERKSKEIENRIIELAGTKWYTFLPRRKLFFNINRQIEIASQQLEKLIQQYEFESEEPEEYFMDEYGMTKKEGLRSMEEKIEEAKKLVKRLKFPSEGLPEMLDERQKVQAVKDVYTFKTGHTSNAPAVDKILGYVGISNHSKRVTGRSRIRKASKRRKSKRRINN